MNTKLLNNINTYKKALDDSYNHIVITDIDGHVIYANKAVERITGFSPEEIIGNTPRLWGKQMDSQVYINLWDQIKSKKQPFHGELINKRKNGERYTALAIISPILTENGELLGFIGTEEDITDIKKTQKELEDKNADLVKLNSFLVGREMKIVELKKKIDELSYKLSLVKN